MRRRGVGRALVADDQFCERRRPLGRAFVETVDNHEDVVEQAPRRRQHLERVVQGAIICRLGTRAIEHGVARRGHRILGDKRVVRQPQITRDRGVSGQAAGKLSGQTCEDPDRIGRERSVRLAVVGRVDARSPLRLPPGIDARNQSGLSGAGAAGDEQHSFGCLEPLLDPLHRPTTLNQPDPTMVRHGCLPGASVNTEGYTEATLCVVQWSELRPYMLQLSPRCRNPCWHPPAESTTWPRFD